jgi:hypothetical protein
MERAWVTWAQIDRGLGMYICYVENHTSPVGFVWGRLAGQGAKSTFETCGSYVPTWARRFGVRSRINETIFQHAATTIITRHGSTEGGMAFLKARGYKWDSNTNYWFLKKSRAK